VLILKKVAARLEAEKKNKFMAAGSALDFFQIDFGSHEYQQLLCLRLRYLREPLGLRFSEKDLASEESDLHFGVRTTDGLIMGGLALRLDGQACRLRQMLVHPDLRRRGVGKSLLKHAETHCVEQNVFHVLMHARLSAKDFYEKCGYRQLGDPFVEVTIPHILMNKHLEKFQNLRGK
jgi:N-acetylglutamate synthase-like GNAT family acetyltransferase